MDWEGENIQSPRRQWALLPRRFQGVIIRPAITGSEPIRFLSYSDRNTRQSPSDRNLLRRESRDKQGRADHTRTPGARTAHDY
jgi:hypothetical protein